MCSGNELFSLLPSVLKATNQTSPHTFMSYTGGSHCNCCSSTEGEGVGGFLLLFSVLKLSFKCVRVQEEKAESKGAT